MLKPAWIGRFHVTGPRSNSHLNGHNAANLWVVSMGGDEPAMRLRVGAALAKQGLTVTRGDRLQEVTEDAGHPLEVRKLLREARRNPEVVFCGKFDCVEDHSGRRPALLELKTERLLLRPWQPRDRDPFAKLNADRDVMQFQPVPLTRHQSNDAVDGYLAGFHQYGFDYLVAEERATGAFVGMMGARIMLDVLPKLQQPAVELDWRLNRNFHRRGFSTEGGRALLKMVFVDFQLPEVVAIVAKANVAGRGLAEKLGMQHRADLDFDHPRFPSRHLYARHLVYQSRNPDPMF